MKNSIINWKTKRGVKLPDPYRGSGPDEWPRFSIESRLPDIGKRLIVENTYPTIIEEKIQALIQAIPENQITMLDDPYGADIHQWNTYIRSYNGLNWLEVPWFFAEFYFYRRILQATHYFEYPENERIDPFQYQKTEGLSRSLKLTESVLEENKKRKQRGVSTAVRLKYLLDLMLRGNQIDLSLWPVDEKTGPDMISVDKETGRYIVNQTDPFIQWILERHDGKINILVDNAGFELLSDLLLAEFLLTENLANQVIMHVKPYPIFVSDALEKDVINILNQLDKKDMELPYLSGFSNGLQRALKDGSLQITTDLYWGLPFALWDMPGHLYQEFSESDLIISKGDANYRRLVGDLRWDHSICFEKVVSYLPCSIVVLRIIKSEAGVGYPAEKMEEIMKIDPDWMKNGKWGCVQFWENTER